MPPNRVIYRDAFEGLAADVCFTYRKGGFESDVILRECPALPEGWDGETARLEVWTEWVEMPEPRVITKILRKEANGSPDANHSGGEVEDQLIDFGAMGLVVGRAFTAGEEGENGVEKRPRILVAKRLENHQGRVVLRESINGKELEQLVKAGGLARKATRIGDRAPNLWASESVSRPSLAARPMALASRGLDRGGVVLDYSAVVSGSSWSFNSGSTYRVTGNVWINGTTYLYGGAVIKYDPNAQLCVSGNFYCYSSSGNKAILTSVDDTTVGETILTGPPSGLYANDALNVYYVTTGTTFQGLHIRYAQDGLFFYSPYGPYYINDSEFVGCQNGVTCYYTSVSLNNNVMCDVTNPTYNYGFGYFTVNNLTTLVGSANNDGDGLSNREEMAVYFTNPLLQDSDQDGILDGTVFVTNIKFNYDTGSTASDAINIRQDYDTPLDLSNGEWVTNPPLNQPVCYIGNRTVFIKARITIEAPMVTRADIWADNTPYLWGPLHFLNKSTVSFVNGVSSPEYVTFQMAGKTLPFVDKSSMETWEWIVYNVGGSGSAPKAMNTSGPHTVYTILGEPKEPWNNTWGSQQNAWLSALDLVCSASPWALYATSFDEAASRITAAINGSGRFAYDTTNGAAKYLAPDWTTVMFSECIQRLNGSNEPSEIVNCTDCANFVTTFANLVGGQSVQFTNVPQLLGAILHKSVHRNWAPFVDSSGLGLAIQLS